MGGWQKGHSMTHSATYILMFIRDFQGISVLIQRQVYILEMKWVDPMTVV